MGYKLLIARVENICASSLQGLVVLGSVQQCGDVCWYAGRCIWAQYLKYLVSFLFHCQNYILYNIINLSVGEKLCMTLAIYRMFTYFLKKLNLISLLIYALRGSTLMSICFTHKSNPVGYDWSATKNNKNLGTLAKIDTIRRFLTWKLSQKVIKSFNVIKIWSGIYSIPSFHNQASRTQINLLRN